MSEALRTATTSNSTVVGPLPDACAIAHAVCAGRTTAVAVVEQALARIDALNPALGAFVSVDAEGARARAERIDAAIARGEDAGPLAGVPFGVKELENVRDWPATDGSTLLADRIATCTSTFVERACAAGAVPVGLTHSPEFGRASYTATALHGVCRNPWDRRLTPGGSSGGSSAAVAAGLVPLATGTDGAGSIRIPASWTGLVGLKPTYARIPRGPVAVGTAHTHVVGVLSRTVRDTARFLDCVVGADERDPMSCPAPPKRFEDMLESVNVRGLQCTWTPDLGVAVCDPDVLAQTHDAFDTLVGELGLVAVDVDVHLPDCSAAFQTTVTPDTYESLHEFMPRDNRPDVDENVRLFYDGAFALGIPDLAVANRQRAALIDTLASVFEKTDLLVLPATQMAAFAAEGPMPDEVAGKPVGHMSSIAVTFPFNLSGHPAICLPAGFVGGAPSGVQIVARRHREDLLLGVAAAFERVRPWPGIATDYR